MTLIRGRIITAGNPSEIADGIIDFDKTITWIGPSENYSGSKPDWTNEVIIPGLIDVHCHGGGGYSFPDNDLQGVLNAAHFHHSKGTTTLLASLVSASEESLSRQISIVSQAVDQGYIEGIHLEGPFISTRYCGSHDSNFIVPGDAAMLERLLILADGRIRSMTLAPETAHCERLVDLLYQYGAFPSWGHTHCSDIQAKTAINYCNSRTTSITHMFNAMGLFHHRDPGIISQVLMAVSDNKIIVELIADGVHLHSDTVAMMFSLCGSKAIALISDAMMAAGMPDGQYRLGSQIVEVSDGSAHILGNPNIIAGSIVTLVDIVRYMSKYVPLSEIVTAASATPARLLTIDHKYGALAEGKIADIVVLNDWYNIQAVYRQGTLVTNSKV